MGYNKEIINGSLKMIEENSELREENQELKKEIRELIQRESYYKALAEKYEEMLENSNRNYD